MSGFKVKPDVLKVRQTTNKRLGYDLIFRRYRRDPNTGQVMDAYKYGIRAWPMWVKK